MPGACRWAAAWTARGVPATSSNWRVEGEGCAACWWKFRVSHAPPPPLSACCRHREGAAEHGGGAEGRGPQRVGPPGIQRLGLKSHHREQDEDGLHAPRCRLLNFLACQYTPPLAQYHNRSLDPKRLPVWAPRGGSIFMLESTPTTPSSVSLIPTPQAVSIIPRLLPVPSFPLPCLFQTCEPPDMSPAPHAMAGTVLQSALACLLLIACSLS